MVGDMLRDVLKVFSRYRIRSNELWSFDCMSVIDWVCAAVIASMLLLASPMYCTNEAR
jgi:hypothetical protein